MSSSVVNFPIDAVYTWVDGNHPKHQELLLQHTQKSKEYCRFSCNNEIYYSLYSIHKFAAWVRKIFIVVADYQHPNLNGLPQALLDKITIVKHSEIMPLSALPTFNSMAIETCLHHISDLSEHFIYFNDDFFLGNYVKPTDFFSPSGCAYLLTTRFYFTHPLFLLRLTFSKRLLASATAYVQWASLKNYKKLPPIIKPIHQCQPCNREVLESLWSDPIFQKDLNQVLHSKTRKPDNIVIMYLMSLVGCSFNTFQIRRHDFQIFINLNVIDIFAPTIKILRFFKPKLFCINNDLKHAHEKVEKVFREELSRYFDGIKPPRFS